MIKKIYTKCLLLFLQLHLCLGLNAQFWELLLEPIFLDGIYYALFEGPNDPSWKETTFASFPYDEPSAGLYLPISLIGDQSRFHAVAHFQNNERRTSGGFVQIKYHPISLLTTEISHLQLIDKDNTEQRNIGFTSFSLSYNRFRRAKLHAWWGLGGIVVNERQPTLNDKAAFSFNLGLNYYFKRPLSLYLETQMGAINESFGALSQARIQVHVERFILYAGYQDLNFGDLEYHGVAIGGGVYF